MHSIVRPLIPCLLAALLASTASCATAENDLTTDSGSGTPVTTVDASLDGGHDGGGIVFVGSPDAGIAPTADAGTTHLPDSGSTSIPDTGSTSFPDTGSTSFPDTGSTSPPDTGTTTTPDSGGASCGFSSTVAACNDCLNTTCCTTGGNCANDNACATCVSEGANAPQSCGNNAAYTAFAECVNTSCATACGGGSSVPTTCAETGGKNGAGCCAGTTNYYCTNGGGIGMETCTGSKVCGWSANDGYYACVSSPGGTDPSDTYPIDCQ